MPRQFVNLAVAVLVAGSSAAEAFGQSWRTVTISRQVENVRCVDVDVRYSAGRFTVGAAEEGTLYRMHLEYDQDRFEPVAEYDGSSIRIGTESRGRRIRIGRNRSAGSACPNSQFVTVALSAPIWIATSRWSRPRSSRRFLMWLPSVRKSVGYSARSGFCPLMLTYQKGNASL